MQYRTLGKTNLKVSEIGMGTWQLAGKPWGWDTPDENESLRALSRYVELGGNFIDTAIVYGKLDRYPDCTNKYSSEQLIGKFIKETGSRDKVIIASKIPGLNRQWPARMGVSIDDVFPKGYIEKMVDESLTCLGIDTLDLMQFHVWQDDFANRDEWKEEILSITKKGKVAFWGISINDYQPSNCLKTLDTGLISTIQLIFNIFHQRPIEKLFPYAKKNNIGLIARVPLDEGSLAGMVKPDNVFNDEMRSIMFGAPGTERRQEVVRRVAELEKLVGIGKEAANLAELALRWILSFKEISTVIPGMRKVEKVEMNVGVSDTRSLSSNLLSEIEKHAWERNFYVDKDPALEEFGYVEK